MRDKQEFFNILSAIDGQPFSEYSRMVGDFDFSRFVLKINPVQNQRPDKSILFLVRVPQTVAGFPPQLFRTPVRRTALEDYLIRRVAEQVDNLARYDRAGLSRRRLHVARPGQKILPRSTIVISEEYIETRIYVDLPVHQGLVSGDSAKEIFLDDLPNLVNRTLIYCNLDEAAVEQFVYTMEDADQIRQLLPTRGFVSFVAQNGRLGRLADTDLPDSRNPRILTMAEDILTEIEAPNSGSLRGWGIPTGITLILGDAYSGRVELMQALTAGIYNHVPDDGREMIVTVPDAVYVAAESGRSVQKVDVSAFMSGTQNGASPTQFTSSHADPFTAQAASTAEALEVGARVLLYDEDDSAPGFLGRDSRLDALLSNGASSAITLSARARQMVDELGISLIVAGSAAVGDFIPVADAVFRIHNYTLENITERAKRLPIQKLPAPEPAADLLSLHEKSRWIVPSSIDPSAGLDDSYIDAPDVNTLRFGRSTVDLRAICQLADIYQTETIGLILDYAKRRYIDDSRPIREVLDLIDRDLSTEGLECLSRDLRGELTRPRRYEIAAALNRLATLRIGHPPE